MCKPTHADCKVIRQAVPVLLAAFGLIAVLNVINLFLLAGAVAEEYWVAVSRLSVWLATPIVVVQQALPLPVGDLLLAIFLVSLVEAAPVLLVWWALSKTRQPKAA